MTEEMAEVPTKKQRTGKEECSIHCTGDNSDLVSPRDFESWQTLVRAAETRNHVVLLELARKTPEGVVPKYGTTENAGVSSP